MRAAEDVLFKEIDKSIGSRDGDSMSKINSEIKELKKMDYSFMTRLIRSMWIFPSLILFLHSCLSSLFVGIKEEVNRGLPNFSNQMFFDEKLMNSKPWSPYTAWVGHLALLWNTFTDLNVENAIDDDVWGTGLY